MNLVAWLAVGGLVGWLASLLMNANARDGVVLNVVIGVAGAFLGGWLLGPWLGTATINDHNFSVRSLVVSLLGAVILLALVRLLRRLG